MTIGERIKNRRKELNLTQEELAKKAGYKNKSDISKMESAGNEIGMNRLHKIAPALNTTVEYLMGWEKDMVDDSPALKAAMRSNDESITAFAAQIYKSQIVDKFLSDETIEVISAYCKLDIPHRNMIRKMLDLPPIEEKMDTTNQASSA